MQPSHVVDPCDVVEYDAPYLPSSVGGIRLRVVIPVVVLPSSLQVSSLSSADTRVMSVVVVLLGAIMAVIVDAPV